MALDKTALRFSGRRKGKGNSCGGYKALRREGKGWGNGDFADSGVENGKRTECFFRKHRAEGKGRGDWRVWVDGTYGGEKRADWAAGAGCGR